MSPATTLDCLSVGDPPPRKLRLYPRFRHTNRLLALPYLPPRARRVASAQCRARRVLDQALAVEKGLDPASPQCARFRPELRPHLDRAVRAAKRGPS
jgi:hypothetical protein